MNEALEMLDSATIRGYQAMQRQSVSYDYEKVFWNSLFSIGLIGTGWIAVQLGHLIAGLPDIKKEFETFTADPGGSIDYEVYKLVFSWVEGENKDKDYWMAPTYAWLEIVLNRRDPVRWAEVKDNARLEHPEWFPSEITDKPIMEKNAAQKVLEAVDSLYAKYGAIMPIGVILGQAGLEYFRVNKIKRDMRK